MSQCVPDTHCFLAIKTICKRGTHHLTNSMRSGFLTHLMQQNQRCLWQVLWMSQVWWTSMSLLAMQAHWDTSAQLKTFKIKWKRAKSRYKRFDSRLLENQTNVQQLMFVHPFDKFVEVVMFNKTDRNTREIDWNPRAYGYEVTNGTWKN